MTVLGLSHTIPPQWTTRTTTSTVPTNHGPDLDDNPLGAFDSETDPGEDRSPSAAASETTHTPTLTAPRQWGKLLAGAAVAALAVAAVAQASVTATWALQVEAPPGAGPGLVYVDTEPSGVEVWIDGKPAGLTPVRLSFSDGKGVIELRQAGMVRMLPITVVPGQLVRQRVEFIAVPPADISPAFTRQPAAAAAATGAPPSPPIEATEDVQDAAAPEPLSGAAADTVASLP